MEENDLKLYILGLLSEEKRTQIELSLLSDDEYYQQLLVLESEMLDAYCRQMLTESERKQFERHYLSRAESQKSLQLAQVFNRAIDELVPKYFPSGHPKGGKFWYGLLQAPQLKWASLVVAIVIGVVVCGLWLSSHSTVAPHKKLNAASEAPRQVPQPTPPSESEVQVALLSPGIVKAFGTTPAEIKLKAQTGFLALQLWLDNDQYPEYQAILQPYDGHDMSLGYYQPINAQEGKYLKVMIPVSELSQRDYRLRLEVVTAQGRQRIESYYFRVQR